MIELRDLLIAAFAMGGAWLGVRVEIRLLWKFVAGCERRIERVEDKLFGPLEG